MKALHLIKVTGIAGAEKHLLILLPSLMARGIDVELVALVEPNNRVDSLAEAAASVGLPFHREVITGNTDPRLIGRLRRLFMDRKPDVVHTHLLHADLFGIPAARLAGVKRVITSRHNDDSFRRSLPMRAIHAGLWRQVDAGIAISEAIRQFCIDVESAPPKKVHTIRYGLPLPVPIIEPRTARAALRESLNLPADSVLIGVVCRLIEQKGVRYGLDAFAKLAADYPSAHLVIAGDGDQRAALESQAKRAGIAKRVHFMGWQKDVQPILAGLDMLLAPSLWEGFGLILIEAMARRLPVIGSAVSAIPEIVLDGETGILTPPRDVPALENALRTLLRDEALRRHMGLMGEDRVDTHFDSRVMVDKTFELYRTIMG